MVHFLIPLYVSTRVTWERATEVNQCDRVNNTCALTCQPALSPSELVWRAEGHSSWRGIPEAAHTQAITRGSFDGNTNDRFDTCFDLEANVDAAASLAGEVGARGGGTGDGSCISTSTNSYTFSTTTLSAEHSATKIDTEKPVTERRTSALSPAHERNKTFPHNNKVANTAHNDALVSVRTLVGRGRAQLPSLAEQRQETPARRQSRQQRNVSYRKRKLRNGYIEKKIQLFSCIPPLQLRFDTNFLSSFRKKSEFCMVTYLKSICISDMV